MKNRILSVLLVVAMLASMIVMPVYATGAVQNGTTINWNDVDCPCGCGAKVGAITDWKEWGSNKFGQSIETAGHYYLTAKMERANILQIKAANVCLDLRGFELTRTSSSPLQVNTDNQLGVIDTVGGGKITGHNSAVDVKSGATLKAVNVTLQNIKTTEGESQNSVIYCSSTGTGTVELDRCTVLANQTQDFWRGAAIIGFGYTVTLKDCHVIGGKVVGDGTSYNNGQGGAIFMSSGTLTVDGGLIEGGKASHRGDAIMITAAAGVLNVKNGAVIEKEVYCNSINTTVNLIGEVTLGNLNLSANDHASNNTKINISELTGGSIGVTVKMGRVFTTAACTNNALKACFTNVLLGNTAAAANAEGMLVFGCPHCNELIADDDWKALASGLKTATLPGNGHYYVNTATYTTAGATSFPAGSDYCIDLRGNTLRRSGDAYLFTAKGSLTVFDSVGGGKMQAGTWVVQVESGAEFNAANITMENALSATAATRKYTDGVINVPGNRTKAPEINLRNTELILPDGNVYGGGAAINGYNANVTLTGCTVDAADVSSNLLTTSTNDTGHGCAIQMGTGTLTMTDCTVAGATATGSGGAIYTGGVMTATDCTINGGTATSHGGAIFGLSTSTITLNNCNVTGGTATGSGGAIYINGTGKDGNHPKLTVTGGTITGGTAGRGDVIYAGNCAIAEFNNCTVSNGTNETSDGIAFYNAGTQFTVNGATIDKVTMATGGAPTVLSGVVTIHEFKPTHESVLNADGRFDISGLLEGSSIGMNIVPDKTITQPDDDVLEKMDYFYNAVEGSEYQVAVNNANQILLCTPMFEMVNGDDTTLLSNRSAADKIYNMETMPNAYLKVLVDVIPALTKPAVIDVNGHSFELKTDSDAETEGNQSFNVTLFDSSNADFNGFGEITINDGTTITPKYTFDGVDYYAVQHDSADATKWSVHALEMEITSVSLSTNAGGMYYWATYNCDDTLAANVESYGIKYELYDVDGVNEIGSNDIVGVVNGGIESPREEIPIMLIKNVVGSGVNGYTDAQTGKMQIKGTPYVKIGDVEYTGATVSKSLYDLCNQVDDLITAGATQYTEFLDNLLNNVWKAYDLAEWTFDNVTVTREA